jgi:hypothetical protein
MVQHLRTPYVTGLPEFHIVINEYTTSVRFLFENLGRSTKVLSEILSQVYQMTCQSKKQNDFYPANSGNYSNFYKESITTQVSGVWC